VRPVRPPIELSKKEHWEVMLVGVASVDSEEWYVFDTDRDSIAVRRDRWNLDEPEPNDAWLLSGEFAEHPVAAAEYVVHVGQLTTPTGPLLARYLEAHCALGHTMLCTWLWRTFGVELPQMLDERFLPVELVKGAPPHAARLVDEILNQWAIRKSYICALQIFAQAGFCRALATRAFDALGPECCERLDTFLPLQREEDFPVFWQAPSACGHYATRAEPSSAVLSTKRSHEDPVVLPTFRASEKTSGISQIAAENERMLATATNLNARARTWGSSVIVCPSDDLVNAINGPLARAGISPAVRPGDTIKFSSTAPPNVAPLFELGQVLQVDSPPVMRPVGYCGALRPTFALVDIAGNTFAIGKHNASDAHVVVAATLEEIHSYCAESLIAIIDNANASDLNWFVRVCSRAMKRLIIVGPLLLLSRATMTLRDVFIETTALDHLASPWEGNHGERAS